MVYLSDDLLAYINTINFGTTELSDEKILGIADRLLLMRIAPALVRINENYYLVNEDFNFVTNQREYVLPQYAMFNKVHSVELISNGATIQLERELPDRSRFRTDTNSGQPRVFWLMHDTLSFYPKPNNSTDSYRVYYYRRPSRLVLTSKAAVVTNVNKLNGEVTYSAAPPATFTATSTHDFYSKNPPFKRNTQGITATALAGAVQTFPIASVQNITVGSYACVLDETVFPDMPPELQHLFSLVIIGEIAKAQNDTTKYQLTDKEINEAVEMSYAVIGQRDTMQSVSLDVTNSPLMAYGWS